MKCYCVSYDLGKPTPQNVYVSKNSTFNVGIKGDQGSTVKLYDGDVELSSIGDFHGYTSFQLTSSDESSRKVLKSKIGNTIIPLNIITTDSNVAELGQGQGGGGSEYVLPIASASTLGGVKVNGNGVSIAADGTLSVDTPSLEGYATEEYVDTAIDAIEIPTKTSDLTNDSGFITSSDIPTIPTKTSDLTNDSGFLSAETDPEFKNWLSGTVDVKIGNGTFGYDDTNYIAIGNGAHSENSDSIAIGTDANADDLGPISPIAIGKEARASQGVAIGSGATGLAGVAIGLSANISNISEWAEGTVAVGESTTAIGTNSVSIGKNAEVYEPDGIAIGVSSLVDDPGSIAIGAGADIQGSGQPSIAIGKNAKSAGLGAVAIGPGALGLYGIAIGLSANLSNLDPGAEGTVAIGESTTAIGENSVAVGKNAEARGSSSVALGYESYVDGNGSVQLGQGVNENDDTLQFQDKVVIDEDGYIPAARLGGITTAVLSGTYDDDTTFSFEVYTK